MLTAMQQGVRSLWCSPCLPVQAVLVSCPLCTCSQGVYQVLSCLRMASSCVGCNRTRTYVCLLFCAIGRQN
jgi:hypothetical protein